MYAICRIKDVKGLLKIFIWEILISFQCNSKIQILSIFQLLFRHMHVTLRYVQLSILQRVRHKSLWHHKCRQVISLYKSFYLSYRGVKHKLLLINKTWNVRCSCRKTSYRSTYYYHHGYVLLSAHWESTPLGHALNLLFISLGKTIY